MHIYTAAVMKLTVRNIVVHFLLCTLTWLAQKWHQCRSSKENKAGDRIVDIRGSVYAVNSHRFRMCWEWSVLLKNNVLLLSNTCSFHAQKLFLTIFVTIFYIMWVKYADLTMTCVDAGPQNDSIEVPCSKFTFCVLVLGWWKIIL